MGHCKVCADLTQLRNTVEGKELQAMVTQFVAYHRAGFMSQRKSYYERKHLATSLPRLYGSIIQGYFVLQFITSK